MLRAAIVLLSCVVFGDVATSDAQQGQRLPGPGTGVVDVQVVREAEVAAAQRGDWRVVQQGEWRVGVHGTVAALPALPRIIRVGSAYVVRGPSIDTVATIRELHESGWALVTTDNTGQQQWINLAAMSSIRER